MVKAQATPIGTDEAARLFAGLSGNSCLMLAVSGGADSMALLILIARWVRELGKMAPSIEVATVDHGLRPESAREADFVAKTARNLGLSHSTLSWSGEKPAAGVQAAARDARYALLIAHARQLEKSPVAILTAHTEEDQAETLLMRLARGSGVDGLAAIAPSRQLSHDPVINLLRPLLGVPRSRLMATLQANGQTYVKDPSNEQGHFERVRLRQAAPALRKLGLDAPHLALAARRLRRAKDALDLAAREAFSAMVDVHGGVFATIERGALTRLPEEIGLRVLTKTLKAFVGTSEPPRLSQIEDLLTALETRTRHAQTLGGAMVSAGSRLIRVYREPNRADLGEVLLRPGQSVRWDGRFLAGLSNGPAAAGLAARTPITVKPLGRIKLKGLSRGTRMGPLPARALETLPAFLAGSELLAVPSLSPWLPELAGPAETTGAEVCTAQFAPTEGP